MNVPKIPWGTAKRIVRAMNVGETAIVRPQWLVSFHNAARRLGMRVVAVSFQRDGELLYRILRVPLHWQQTGHAVARWPERNSRTGQWRKDAA